MLFLEDLFLNIIIKQYIIELYEKICLKKTVNLTGDKVTLISFCWN